MIEILLILFIILYLYFYFKKESFNNFKKLLNKTNGNKEEIFKSIDKTLEKKAENKLDIDNLDLDDPIFLEYLDKQIISDTLKTNDFVNSKLPQIIDDDYVNYNHQLKLLINSKKIRQDYILEILKKKIKYLTETLKNIDDIKQK